MKTSVSLGDLQNYLVFCYEEILQFVFTHIYCIYSCVETVANR